MATERMGPVQRRIEAKLQDEFAPNELIVRNESHLHSVPPGSEMHFKVVVVSPSFEGEGVVGRHRAVNRALADEFENGLHALSITALTPAEWQEKNGEVTRSPACRGGAGA